jgi:hypothetical protein
LIADVEKRLSSLTSSYCIKKIVENFIKKHTHTQSLLPTTKDQILPTPMAPSNTHPVPAPDHLLNKKVSKACRIEGSKSSLFMFVFAFGEFKLSHVIITALQQRR